MTYETFEIIFFPVTFAVIGLGMYAFLRYDHMKWRRGMLRSLADEVYAETGGPTDEIKARYREYRRNVENRS